MIEFLHQICRIYLDISLPTSEPLTIKYKTQKHEIKSRKNSRMQITSDYSLLKPVLQHLCAVENSLHHQNYLNSIDLDSQLVTAF